MAAGWASVPRIRTVVCDDERRTRRAFVALLGDDEEIDVVGEASDGLQAAELIESSTPDLVFLDVHMPHLDGFGVAARLHADEGPTVVFVTAHEEYALKAFEVHAVDYLVKPIDRARLEHSLSAAKQRVRERRVRELGERLALLLPPSRRDGHVERLHQPPPSRQSFAERIPVRIGRNLTYVPVSDVYWIEADNYYARLHVGERNFLVRQSMRELEARLDPAQFVRVHRSAIVRIAEVDRLQPRSRGAHLLTLKDGSRLTLSRSRRAAFEAALGGRG